MRLELNVSPPPLPASESDKFSDSLLGPEAYELFAHKQKRTTSQSFRQSPAADHSPFVEYGWRSKLRKLADYMAEMAMLD